MCGIWKRGKASELDYRAYAGLPQTLRNINISGGEPFLREDLVEIIGIIRHRCKGARILISSNGLLPDLIERRVAKMPEVGVRISIDGIGETHDNVRGVNGSFQRAQETTVRLRRLGVKDLGIAATMTKENAHQIVAVQRLAEELGVEFTCAVAHSSPIYFGTQGDAAPASDVAREQLALLARRQLSSLHPKDWFRAYFTSGLIDYVDGRARRVRCTAGRRFIFLDPVGDVYPCNMLDMRMGNITQQSFPEILHSSQRILEYVERCPQNCWMVCTVAPMMRKNPFKPMLWILGSKWLTPFGGLPRIGGLKRQRDQACRL
jgi:MoaA/NifB/PqqE/SkfB family radical SAM enzyme